MIERILIGLLTGGHVLLEGVPGLAKTLTVRTLCRRPRDEVLSASSSRPTCCPPTSSAPSSTTRHAGEFTPKQGPIFANLVLADEINRAPAKVQRALLEAMQERQVTIGDTTLPAARSVPGDGDAEPDRAGGHLPAARGAARSLHADDQGRLSDARGRARDHGSHDVARCSRSAERVATPAGDRRRRAASSARSTSTSKIKDYIVTWCSRRASRRRTASTDLARLIEYGAIPRASHRPQHGGARARVPAPPRLRHARGRQGDRRPTCCATA